MSEWKDITSYSRDAEEGYLAGRVAKTTPSTERERWIPLNEQLPEFTKKVLIAQASGRVCEAERQPYSFSTESWFWWVPDGRNLGSDTVTHWRPMPKPPGAEAERVLEGK